MKDLLTFHKDASTRVQAVDGIGATLVANTTYYVDLTEEEGESAGLTSIEWMWDASLIAAITVEASNFSDVTPYIAAASGFAALTAIPTVTIAGGSVGISVGSWTNQGFGRLRARVAVGATGGLLRSAINHKR